MSQRRQMRVEDVMTAEVHSIDGLATVAEAMALMQKARRQLTGREPEGRDGRGWHGGGVGHCPERDCPEPLP